MKGIILAAGEGARLSPATVAVPKPLLLVYDKPMIYYALALLLQAGIREIAIVVLPREKRLFHDLLGNGEELGVQIEYLTQKEPKGVLDAFALAERFAEGDKCCLVFGDQVLFGAYTGDIMATVSSQFDKGDYTGAYIFGHAVRDPTGLGIVEVENHGHYVLPIRLQEKPKPPHKKETYFAVPGVYFYDEYVFDHLRSLTAGGLTRPDSPGLLSITDLNRGYLERDHLSVKILGVAHGYHWHDAGTPEGLLRATIDVRDELKIRGQAAGAVEAIAMEKEYITPSDLVAVSGRDASDYGDYLHDVALGKRQHLL